MTAWNEAAALRDNTPAPARLDDAYAAWDKAATAIDQARKKQMAAPDWPNQRRKRSPPWTANGTA